MQYDSFMDQTQIYAYGSQICAQICNCFHATLMNKCNVSLQDERISLGLYKALNVKGKMHDPTLEPGIIKSKIKTTEKSK